MKQTAEVQGKAAYTVQASEHAKQAPAQAEQTGGIDSSPLMVMQRQKLRALFGDAAQRQESKENPVQPMFASQRAKESEPVVQRFVHYETGPNLYVSDSWPETKNADGIPVKNALNIDNTKFKEIVKPRVQSGYGIDAYNTTIKNDFSEKAEEFAEYQLQNNKDVQMKLLDAAWQQKNPQNDGLNIFLNKMRQASSSRRYGSLLQLGCDLDDFKSKAIAGVEKFVDQDFYLLHWNDARLFGDDPENTFNSLVRVAKPVLLPVDYLENDSDSDVDVTIDEEEVMSSALKTKVCCLISMVYQKATSVATKPLAKEKVSQLLGKFGINILASNITADNIQSGKYLPNNEELYGTILLELHKYLQPNGTLYDLDRYSEQVLADAGYTRIVSCNCDYKDLPANIPPHITLKAGESYIFHIRGHAQAVVIKQDIPGQLGETAPTVLDSHTNYFTVFNETTSNFNADAWNKPITAIWKE